MSTTLTLKAVGLNTNPNQLDLPEGSLIQASNVIINRENVIEPRRGFKLFGESFGSVSDRCSQMFEYKDRIIRHYSDKIEFQNGTLNSGVENFDQFSGSFADAQVGLRMKKVDSAGNLYFTTSEGIKKISAKTASQFSTAVGYIVDAGGIKAVDFSTELVVTPNDQTSFLPQDSAVAYRVVWGTKDANDVLIPGTPSQRNVIYNQMISLILQDYLRVLLALDNVSNDGLSLISDANYVDTLKLPINATAIELQTNLLALTQKIDIDLLFANDTGVGAPLNIDSATSTTISSGVYTINFSSGTASDYFLSGDKIYLEDFTPTTGTLNGIQTVATSTATSITINTTATSPVTVGAACKISSAEYRSIAAPAVPIIPTPNQDLVNLQNYLNSIITDLQLASDIGTPPPITSASRIAYIDVLDITTNASVRVTITIPEDVTPNYFFQVYRSGIAQATGAVSIDDIVPSDELQLVYEAYPTTAELAASELTFIDITPDDFRGANLYTNSATGEGILQSNDLPPFALDINRFKNVVFYANTRTRHRKSLNLVGVSNMIIDYGNSITPMLSIIGGSLVNTYSFVTGVNEETTVVCTAGGTLAAAGPGDYFEINSAEDDTEYYVWYQIGTTTDPLVANKQGIRVVANAADTAVQIAQKTADTISSYPQDFLAEVTSGSTVTVTTTKPGYTTDAIAGTSPFTVTVTIQGVGEDASINQVLLSSSVSVATAVDETARSLVRVINKNASEQVYAYYISGSEDVPGKIFLEAKSLVNVSYYLVANNSSTGTSFTPDLSPTLIINSITTGASPIITTSAVHGLTTDETVIISLTDSTPVIDGIYIVKVLSPTTFQIQPAFTVTVAGTTGVAISSLDVITSENEQKPNRVYYSKLSQPEAVPLLNYLDVGDSDKEILRIFPLRDSLFVFKEDGVYRISGENEPFTLSLFDSSCVLVAPDSLDVSNNVLYCFTTQGVSAVTEGGASIISLPIDETIERVRIFNNYKTLSFGLGYEEDNAYTLYTVQTNTDESATIGYRYSTKTNTWTTFDQEFTCGFVNPIDSRSYFGSGNINQIEQERKALNRTDYSDREYTINLLINNYFDNILKFTSVSNIVAGDVLLQTQFLTIYEYNMLLKKLDIDPGIADSDYFSTLEAVSGDSLRTKIIDLANKLDADLGVSNTDYFSSIDTQSGAITLIDNTSPVEVTSAAHGLFSGRYISIAGSDSAPTIDGNWIATVTTANIFTIDTDINLNGTTGTWQTLDTNFQDIKGCYNIIINKLNNDPGVSFVNYTLNTTTTIMEAVVLSVDKNQKNVTLNLTLQFIQGPMTHYKSIPTSVSYSPILFGDPVNYKHLREATIMFTNKVFTSAKLSFASDLLPQYVPIPFPGDGNGIFGHATFGSGFFGGGSHGAPFRTYIPRQCQRCRYSLVKFDHSIARENYGIFGISITGENTNSPRAYRG